MRMTVKPNADSTMSQWLIMRAHKRKPIRQKEDLSQVVFRRLFYARRHSSRLLLTGPAAIRV